jgi:hypothetical protein
LPVERRNLSELKPGLSHQVDVEHPVEIALKKMLYRGTLFKVRDIFDTAVVDSRFPDLLRNNLHHVSHLKAAILARLANISKEYARSELAELNIADEWRSTADICLERMQEIAENIPEPKCMP